LRSRWYQKASEASLAIPACIFVGVVNAVGSGLIRDVLVREEPLLFKPGQFYVTASFLGVAEFMLVTTYGHAPDRARRHLSDGNHICLPSPHDLFRLEDQTGHATTALRLILMDMIKAYQAHFKPWRPIMSTPIATVIR
jgi:hypothetical protein